MNKKTTIKDIAKKANVSIATVSRVLRRTDYPVSQDVKKRVFDAADELEYKPNLFGRMLRGDASIEIGIIVPSINNPFYAAQVAASEEECLSRNFIPIICNSNSNPGLESWYLEMLEERQAAGILLTTIQNEETFVKRIERLNMPVLLVNQGIENYTGDRVLFNFFKAGYMAAEYLIECGHKDLALASGPITRHNRREILRGFKQALLDYDIVFNKRRIVNYDSKYDIYNIGDDQGAIQIIDKMFEEEYLPEGIVAINDSLAIKMINELHNRGIHVPNDISIVGMDDIFVSKMVTPRLTTIHEPAEEMGKRSAKYLIDKIEGKSRNIVNITMQPTLVERNSVRKVHSKIRR